MTNREKMTALCRSFPTLRGVPGTDPWQVDRLLYWLCFTGAPTGGSAHAARFVLSVWSPGTDWPDLIYDDCKAAAAGKAEDWITQQLVSVWTKRADQVREENPGISPASLVTRTERSMRDSCRRAGPFDLAAAMASWDAHHRASCRAWVEAPFFP